MDRNKLLSWASRYAGSLALAVVVVAIIIAVMLGGTMLLTARLASEYPDRTVQWGWMFMWTVFRNPYEFHPLLCENAPAHELTNDYLARMREQTFRFEEVQVEVIDDNLVRGTAIVFCGEDETERSSNWEAEFITKFDTSTGNCIQEINVITSDTCLASSYDG